MNLNFEYGKILSIIKCYWLEGYRKPDDGVLFKAKVKSSNENAPVKKAITKGRITIDSHPGFLDRNSFGSTKGSNFLKAKTVWKYNNQPFTHFCLLQSNAIGSGNRRRTTNSVRFDDIDQSFDEIRREFEAENGPEDSITNHTTDSNIPKNKPVDELIIKDELRSPSQMTKESGYFS